MKISEHYDYNLINYVKWDNEDFFINKEDALKYYKEELEYAKDRKHTAGEYINLPWYYSSPR